MKFLVNFLLFAIFYTQAYAQQRVMKPADLVSEARINLKSKSEALFDISDSRVQIQLPEELTDYTLLNFNLASGREILSRKNPFIELSIPGDKREALVLELVEVNILAEGFSVIEAPSMTPVHAVHGKHYRGVVKDKPGSVAALSVYEGEAMGIISIPEEGNLVIGKIEGADQHIFYNDHQLSHKFGMECGTDDTGTAYTRDQLSGAMGGTRSLTDCTRLYLEIDHDIFLNKGSSTAAVNTFITGIFNQVATLYSNEQINTVISEIVIWTQPSPYNATSSSGMLNAFTAYRQGFNGDLAQLLSYKASGGIAYLDGLCRTNPDYSMSYAGIQSTYQNVPTYSWTVEVCTHEFGHLFGSQHTHACVWNGNGTAIDGCYTTEGGCPSPGLPSGGGTIMSYCHLTGAGINFANGFGLQPGNVIRSEVTVATCLQACSGGGGGGGGGSNPCNNISLTMELKTDNYPGETTWNIKNSTGTILYSGGPYNVPNTLNTISLCLPAGCYTFTINDTYGDGICCSFGNGYYNIKQGTTTLISGGQFASQEIKSFCASGVTPTCTDGVQNGQETGVDCGGPTCPACPTCTDGIQNGQETGVDCGGPTCPACPTCTDGVQNGQETGVDCGGPTCPPCSGTGQVQVTNIAGNYFETGWDGWIDGGIDCARTATTTSPEGTYSIRLRDNSGDQSAMTSQVYNFSQYDSVTVEFKFRAIGFEADEDFFVLLNNGGTWSNIATLATPADFINGTLYTRKYRLAGPFSSTCMLKVQADANDDTDQVYIDAVVIRGYKTVAGASCTDGIQNGQETGVDCGGPLCPACPTCNDGIQNGTETGIDCGGNCPACTTCNDGIQNGNETGIDCGGSCSPCGNGNTVTISGSYFEAGWDNWIDGGTDCYRYQGTLSAEGTYSIRLRDNSFEQSAMTSPAYNLSGYNGVSVEFKFIADGMEPGEDFWLQYYNGTAWNTVATLVSGNQFVNNQFYTVTVNLTGTFSTSSLFRFMCDGSENDDIVYIDAVVIRATTGSSIPATSLEITALPVPLVYDQGIEVYPNPVSDRLTIRCAEPVISLKVYSASGHLISDRIPEDNTTDLSGIPAGLYLIRVETAESVYNTRIVKM